MSASVVKSLPAILSMVSMPARAHRRRELTDIEPSGNAILQAIDNLKGVVSVISLGGANST
jgi:hypothetical protein